MSSSNGNNNSSPPFLITFMAGGIGGIVGATITCPLEVVKTRLQSSIHHATIINNGITYDGVLGLRTIAHHIQGTMGVLRSIYINEGLSALWKGMGATMIGVVPARAIHFSSYQYGKKILTNTNGEGIIGLKEGSSLLHLSSAAIAGIITATLTNPIWVVKTRMQLQSLSKVKNSNINAINSNIPLYRNSLDCAISILKKDGVKGLYRGMTASYVGVSEGIIQWVLYEKIKKKMGEYRGRKDLKWIDYFGIAAITKMVAAIACYPHEVVRTRLREENKRYKGFSNTFLRILREEGAGALYGGMTAHLLRVIPNSAIMFFCYEFILISFHKISHNNK